MQNEGKSCPSEDTPLAEDTALRNSEAPKKAQSDRAVTDIEAGDWQGRWIEGGFKCHITGWGRHVAKREPSGSCKEGTSQPHRILGAPSGWVRRAQLKNVENLKQTNGKETDSRDGAKSEITLFSTLKSNTRGFYFTFCSSCNKESFFFFSLRLLFQLF